MESNLISKPVRGLAVDVGTSGNPGETFYRGIDIFTRKIVFEANLGLATNNIGEFLAVCHGIHYCYSKNIRPVIYTDSVTALAWVRKEKVNTSFTGNKEITERLEKAIKYLKSIPLKDTLVIEKWDTEKWGEIPADYGRK